MGHQNTEYTTRCALYFFAKQNGDSNGEGGSVSSTIKSAQSISDGSPKSQITASAVIWDFLMQSNLAENRKMCYTYDELGRVRTRVIKDLNGNVISEESFNYDAAGNITAANNDSLSYDTNNRLTEYLGHAVEYDADGNMLSNGITNFEYDSANRLLKAGGNAYIYNAEDVRIKNLCGDFETTYTYNTNCKLSQLLCKTTNGITTKYVYGLGLIGQEKENEFKTYHFDYRGSTVAITNINGTITDTFKYDTYGKMVEHIGTSFVIFGYNGRDGVITDNNGLIYMRARYYSPDMRRFVNADILHGEISDSTSLNRYSYVNGNPVSYVDPFGLAPDEGKGNAINTVSTSTSPRTSLEESVFERFMNALIGSFVLEGGVGFGLGVTLQIEPFKISPSIYHDILTGGIAKGEHYTAIVGSAGISAEIGAKHRIGFSTQYEHRFETGYKRTVDEHTLFSSPWHIYNCELTNKDPFQFSFPFVKPVKGELSDDTMFIGLSFEGHLIFGSHFTIGIDAVEFRRLFG